MLSFYRLSLPGGLLPSCFAIGILYAPLLFPIRATCSVHLSLLDLIARVIYLYSSNCYVLICCLLMICQDFSVSSKVVFRRVSKNCCFMSDIYMYMIIYIHCVCVYIYINIDLHVTNTVLCKISKHLLLIIGTCKVLSSFYVLLWLKDIDFTSASLNVTVKYFCV